MPGSITTAFILYGTVLLEIGAAAGIVAPSLAAAACLVRPRTSTPDACAEPV
jgi:hypothetical protein